MTANCQTCGSPSHLGCTCVRAFVDLRELDTDTVRDIVMELTEYEKKVLAALEWRGGMLTRDVADRVRPRFGNSQHQHSAAVRSWLMRLEKLGLVRRLDDKKPVCWVRTACSRQQGEA